MIARIISLKFGTDLIPLYKTKQNRQQQKQTNKKLYTHTLQVSFFAHRIKSKFPSLALKAFYDLF